MLLKKVFALKCFSFLVLMSSGFSDDDLGKALFNRFEYISATQKGLLIKFEDENSRYVLIFEGLPLETRKAQNGESLLVPYDQGVRIVQRHSRVVLTPIQESGDERGFYVEDIIDGRSFGKELVRRQGIISCDISSIATNIVTPLIRENIGKDKENIYYLNNSVEDHVGLVFNNAEYFPQERSVPVLFSCHILSLWAFVSFVVVILVIYFIFRRKDPESESQPKSTSNF